MVLTALVKSVCRIQIKNNNVFGYGYVITPDSRKILFDLSYYCTIQKNKKGDLLFKTADSGWMVMEGDHIYYTKEINLPSGAKIGSWGFQDQTLEENPRPGAEKFIYG